jgi:RHH-type rel operon transcriptional repressor/antitoxin RelB
MYYASVEKLAMSTSIRLPDDIEKRLEALARKTGRTKSYYIREMILEKIDDLEDYYLAADRAERIRQGRQSVSSSKQVREELGLESRLDSFGLKSIAEALQ